MHESTKTWLTGLLGQATKEKVYGVRTIENGLVILGRIFIVAASLQGGGAVVTPQKSWMMHFLDNLSRWLKWLKIAFSLRRSIMATIKQTASSVNCRMNLKLSSEPKEWSFRHLLSRQLSCASVICWKWQQVILFFLKLLQQFDLFCRKCTYGSNSQTSNYLAWKLYERRSAAQDVKTCNSERRTWKKVIPSTVQCCCLVSASKRLPHPHR